MRDSLLNRRVVLKLGGAGLAGGLMTPSPVGAQTDDSETGQINDLTGFETPQSITDDSHRFQLITPANRLTIDAATNDTIDLVFEWDDSITIEGGNRSVSGSGILFGEEDVGEQRAIFRGVGRESDDIVYDRLTLRDLDTSTVTPGDEVEVTVSARQADSSQDTDNFEDVVAAVDDGTFDAEVTTEATFEVTQGTFISTNNAETTNLDLARAVEHTIAFDIDQLRDGDAGGTPAGPAKGIIINYFMDNDDDGFDFDLTDNDVTLGSAAANLDLEVVKSREIPGVGQILLEIADNNTLEDDANLEIGDTVTVELSGLDTADINPDEFDNASSTVEVGLHGAATFDPIVDESITPDRGAYTIDSVDFEFGDRTGPTEIGDWYDLDEIRNDLDGNYVLAADIDKDTAGYDDVVANRTSSEFTESLSFSQDETQAVLARTPVDELTSIDTDDDINLSIVDPEEGIIERQDGSSFGSAEITYTTQDEQFVGFEPIGEVDYNNDIQFLGVFDGNGHEIADLRINRTDEDHVGLFSVLNNEAVITNVGVTNVTVAGGRSVGGLMGINFSTGDIIENSYVTGEVTGRRDVGGLVGSISVGTIENSYSTANVTGDNRVGGLAGTTESSEINGSYATGTVTGHEGRVGGLIGTTGADNVSTCYATGNVNAENANAVGGLVGRGVGTISGSYATGSVTCNSSVGGLVGDHFGDVNTSFADTAVEATGDNAVIGGLVGILSDEDIISQSYALGSVTADDASSIGGLVGESNDQVRKSYAAVNIDGTGTNIGGFIGELTGSQPEDSYWDTEVSGQGDSSDAEGLSTDEMTGDSAVTTMEGFDFDAVWESQADPDEYPTLQTFQQDEPTTNFVVTVVEPTEGAEVREDEQLDVTVEITNSGGEPGSQDIALTAPIESTLTAVEVASEDETQVEFTIPEADIQGSFDITVESEDTTDSVSVTAVDPCFIATAAYNTPQADEIDVLREFRDRVLTKHAVGRAITKAYYTTSPPVANWIRQTKQRRQVVRKYFVEPLVRTVDQLPDRSD